MTKPSVIHVEWCKRMFSMIADGGTWAVPRSGLVFQRKGNELVLNEVMPYHKRMPISESELHKQQDADFQMIQFYFGLAGVTVRRA